MDHLKAAPSDYHTLRDEFLDYQQKLSQRTIHVRGKSCLFCLATTNEARAERVWPARLSLR